MSFALHRFFYRLLLTMRTGGVLVLALIISYRILDQHLTSKLQDELFDHEGMGAMVWVYAGASLLITLFYPVLTTVLIIGSLKAKSLGGSLRFLQQKFSFVLREQMRALGIALLWGIPLIIPTFWKFFQFIFVPFIVCLDSRYSGGNIHAPRRSAELVRRKFWSVLFLSLGLFLVLPLFMLGLQETYNWDDHPLQISMIVLFEFCVTICGQLLIIRLWERAHGTDFQLS